VLLGALGWAVTRAVSKNPRKLLRWLVPAVVAASCIPDLFLLDQGGTAGVLAAALMHLAPATIAVPIYRRLLPLPS
jgi:branched-subunit amino acid transport protein